MTPRLVRIAALKARAARVAHAHGLAEQRAASGWLDRARALRSDAVVGEAATGWLLAARGRLDDKIDRLIPGLGEAETAAAARVVALDRAALRCERAAEAFAGKLAEDRRLARRLQARRRAAPERTWS